jgi:ATP-dependent DNA helicase RecQ
MAPSRFGAAHLIDVLRGKATDKVVQYGHTGLSTFGVGAELSVAQWRAVLRQLVARGILRAEGEFNTLELTESARAVLRGEVSVIVRRVEPARRVSGRAPGARKRAAELELETDGQRAFEALRTWRAQVAKEHGLPAYVVFHDATLAEIARRQPGTLAALAGVQGVGATKLERYGPQILDVLAEVAPEAG